MESSGHPVAGVDSPRTFQEFDEWFGSETACREYIQKLRWPEGVVCPDCGAVGEPWVMSRNLLRCRACDRQVSLTAGTIFQDTRKPLRLWLLAMWFVTSQKNGVSALGLQRVLGLGSYETAWTWLHKLRRAMVRPGRDCLSGKIEVDETYVGGSEEGKRGRQIEDKAIVVIAAEESGRGIGLHAGSHKQIDIGCNSEPRNRGFLRVVGAFGYHHDRSTSALDVLQQRHGSLFQLQIGGERGVVNVKRLIQMPVGDDGERRQQFAEPLAPALARGPAVSEGALLCVLQQSGVSGLEPVDTATKLIVEMVKHGRRRSPGRLAVKVQRVVKVKRNPLHGRW